MRTVQEMLDKPNLHYGNVDPARFPKIAHKIAWPDGRIPDEAVFLSDEPVSEADTKWAMELAKKYGWEK